MAHIRLDKFLANAGIGTRREMRESIKLGKVSINGDICIKSEAKVDCGTDIVCFNGIAVSFEKYKYIMLNKPKGVISATQDKTKKTVIDLLDSKYRRCNLFPVGRLDKDTVGLLILSNDGSFAHNTLSPKKHIEKTYIAHIDGYIDESHVKAFDDGIVLSSGYKCLKAKLTIMYSSEEISKVKVQIKEGKYHQIKKMFGTFYKNVIYLKRIQFHNITLDENLLEGEYRRLSEDEMKGIKAYIDKG